jgi:hypothetical protein
VMRQDHPAERIVVQHGPLPDHDRPRGNTFAVEYTPTVVGTYGLSATYAGSSCTTRRRPVCRSL